MKGRHRHTQRTPEDPVELKVQPHLRGYAALRGVRSSESRNPFCISHVVKTHIFRKRRFLAALGTHVPRIAKIAQLCVHS